MSRDVIMMMADHSGGPTVRGERRTLDEVSDQYPGVTIETLQMVSKRERTIALDEDLRRDYLADENSTPHSLASSRALKWQVNLTEDADLADAIVAKLLQQDSKLAKKVYNKLDSEFRPRAKRR